MINYITIDFESWVYPGMPGDFYYHYQRNGMLFLGNLEKKDIL